MKTHAEDSPIPALRAAEGAVRTDANTAPTTEQGASTFAGYEDERDLGVPPAPVHPATTIRSADAARYHIPPELAQELTWQDAYFADDDPDDGGGGENTNDGIVAVFDLDYDLMEERVFDSGNLVKAVAASIAIPGVILGPTYDGHCYVDGGVTATL